MKKLLKKSGVGKDVNEWYSVQDVTVRMLPHL
jgi:hypothetical protein